MFEAVILAGGAGTRLKEITGNIPKPMVEINGIPFLYRLLGLLESYGCSRVVLALGYEAKYIVERLLIDSPVKIEVDFVIEEAPLGTGGAVKLAAEKISSDKFLVLNGDTLLEIDFMELFQASISHNMLISVTKVEDVSRYGSLTLSSDGKILSFNEKGAVGKGYINGGVYALRREDILSFSETQFSLESDYIANYSGRIGAFITRGYFIDIGIPEDYHRATIEIK